MTNVQIVSACDMYANGKSAYAIGDVIGVGHVTVLRALKNSGVIIKSQADRMRGKAWSESRRSKTPERAKRRTRKEFMEEKIGNKSFSSHGYVRVNIGNGKRQYEHILIAEKALGRKLKRNERVHHIDCNRSNNSSDNLLICTHDYHLALHARMRAHPYWSQFK